MRPAASAGYPAAGRQKKSGLPALPPPLLRSAAPAGLSGFFRFLFVFCINYELLFVQIRVNVIIKAANCNKIVGCPRVADIPGDSSRRYPVGDLAGTPGGRVTPTYSRKTKRASLCWAGWLMREAGQRMDGSRSGLRKAEAGRGIPGRIENRGLGTVGLLLRYCYMPLFRAVTQ